METPKPGIYENIPFDEYVAWNAVSNSKLSLLDKSPRIYQQGIYKGPTPNMRLGSLTHCGILEPLAFAGRYAVAPDFHLYAENSTADGRQTTSKNTAFVKERLREFTAMAEGREIVDRDWYDNTLTLVRELAANSEAKRLLSNGGPSEVSIVWEERGFTMKARIDKVFENCLVDLKTTTDVLDFENTIGRYAYHRQMAHYQEGWRILTGTSAQCWLVAVEPKPPHAVMAAPLSDDALSEGHAARSRLLDSLEACTVCNEWPARPNPKAWNLPNWAVEPIALTINGKDVEL